jgi:hypothetical protein
MIIIPTAVTRFEIITVARQSQSSARKFIRPIIRNVIKIFYEELSREVIKTRCFHGGLRLEYSTLRHTIQPAVIGYEDGLQTGKTNPVAR